jgi:hypothetical protein
LTREKQQYEFHLRSLEMEKEEMVRTHALETGDLRKKISVLTEHVQRLESTAMSSSFNADYSDIDSLAMGDAWDSISFLNDYPADTEIQREVSAELAPISEQDMPAAEGLLMLLASNGSSPAIP